MAKASLILVMALSLSIISLFGVVKALHADLIHNNLPDEDDGGQIDKVNAATGEVSMMGTTSHVFTFFLAPHYFNWTDPSNGMDKDLVRYR